MSFDDLQSKWQSHDHGKSLSAEADLLANEVRRNHRAFEMQLWKRDVGEVIAATLITGVFVVLAVSMQQWSLYLCGAGSLFVGLFLVVDRVKQRRRRSVIENSLQSTIEASLAQVQHQIWLLRNILWWYLFPLVPGIVVLLGSASWQSRGSGIAEQAVIAVVGMICAVAFWQVYRVNHREIRKTLEPRRKELEELRDNLNPLRPIS